MMVSLVCLIQPRLLQSFNIHTGNNHLGTVPKSEERSQRIQVSSHLKHFLRETTIGRSNVEVSGNTSFTLAVKAKIDYLTILTRLISEPDRHFSENMPL